MLENEKPNTIVEDPNGVSHGDQREYTSKSEIVSEVSQQIQDQLESDQVASMVLEMRRAHMMETRLRILISSLSQRLGETQKIFRDMYLSYTAHLEYLYNQGVLDKSAIPGKDRESLKELCLDPKYRVAFGVCLDLGQTGTLANGSKKTMAEFCRTPFALRTEEVKGGFAEWDDNQPFMNKRNEDGYCVHFDQESQQCTIGENRPARCRSFVENIKKAEERK